MRTPSKINLIQVMRSVGLVSTFAILSVSCGQFRSVSEGWSSGSPLEQGAGDPTSKVSVALAWDPNTEPELAGYMVHFGTSSGVYDKFLNVGNLSPESGIVSYTVGGLDVGQTYYFVVRAYDSNFQESLGSNEFSWTAVP